MAKKILLGILCVFFLTSCNNAKKRSNELVILADNLFIEWFQKSDNELFQKALALCDEAIEIDPTNWQAYYMKLQYYKNDYTYDKPNYAKMIKVYEKYIENGNELNNVHKFGYACALYSNDKQEIAKQYYREVAQNLLKLQEKRINPKYELDVGVGILSLYMLEELDFEEIGSYIKNYTQDIVEQEYLWKMLLENVSVVSLEEIAQHYAGL